MNIDFELYRIFNEVAIAGNITAASERLHISQPAVSKSIKSLESQLGGPLFVRTKRGVILTEEGKELHNYIKTGIEYFRNAEHKFGDMISLESGVIKIGISRTLVKEYLLPYLEEFHKLYPKVKIEINTSMASDLIPKLRNGLIDFIISNMPSVSASDIKLDKLREVHDIFVVSKDFKIDKYEIDIKEINNYPLVLQPIGNSTRNYLDEFLSKNGVHANPEMCLASYGLVYDMTKIGYGIGYVVKEYVEEDLKNGDLVEIKTNPKIPSRHVALLTKKDSIPSFAAKKFIDLLKK